ncbi:MAG: hypothetical protein R3E18_00995 [Sphingomonadaceae bacterium]|nr:hypothetical protein [Sphingomonadaceae bacterium]
MFSIRLSTSFSVVAGSVCDIVAKRKPKTRIAVKCKGRLREVMSIRERSNGDLVVLAKGFDYTESFGPDFPVKEKRWSVHVSPSSEGHLCKHTVEFENRDDDTLANWQKPGPDGFASKLFARTYPTLDPKKYDLVTRSKDDIVMLGKGDLGRLTLALAFAVLDKTFPRPEALQAGIEILQFQQFDVLIAYWAIPVLAFNWCDFVHFPTFEFQSEEVLTTPPAKQFYFQFDLSLLMLGSATATRHQSEMQKAGHEPGSELWKLVSELAGRRIPF